MAWDTLADEKQLTRTATSLEANNIKTIIVNTGKEAKEKIFELLPKGSEVMPMTSVTLDAIGVSEALEKSTEYISLRKKLMSMDRKTQGREMQKLGATPDWTIGSAHAITEDGHVLIASNTGSQLPAYAYGAGHVIWVVGTQKIVKNTDEGIKRIYEYTLPLEGERAKKTYGVLGSAVNKLLIINKEVMPGRITLIFVKEKLGF